jgi:hypothetical protein
MTEPNDGASPVGGGGGGGGALSTSYARRRFISSSSPGIRPLVPPPSRLCCLRSCARIALLLTASGSIAPCTRSEAERGSEEKAELGADLPSLSVGTGPDAQFVGKVMPDDRVLSCRSLPRSIAIAIVTV